MNEPPPSGAEWESRLDAIPTRQSLLRLAHDAAAAGTAAARNALVLRYRRAIRGYLGAILKDDADADEVTHRVVLSLLQGGFAGADPTRGRFRDYLKRSVRNAALAFLRDRGRAAADAGATDPPADDPAERLWRESCRRSVLDAALASLEDYEKSHPGNAFATAVRLAGEHPDLDSGQLAALAGERLGRPIRADAFRQQLRRARCKLAEFLWVEVSRTLGNPTAAAVEEELGELGLLSLIADYLPDEAGGH